LTYLIDSDKCISYLRKQRRAIDLIDSLRIDGVAISIVTYAELHDGVYGSVDPMAAEQGLLDFLADIDILPVTLTIARRFAAIRGELRRAGNLILDMDLLIAATAIEHDLTLVTGNRRHFDRIPGLTLDSAT
jgi:tRNA(fMet)-specific endonuclease VapC